MLALFYSKAHGDVLALDDIIQVTERDEFTYHEMLSFLPLNSHPNPENVSNYDLSTLNRDLNPAFVMFLCLCCSSRSC